MTANEWAAIKAKLDADIRRSHLADVLADWTVCILTALGLIAIAFGWLS